MWVSLSRSRDTAAAADGNKECDGPAADRTIMVHRSGYTHVSSHILARQSSIGIAVPVYSGQK
ncbi:hypothetical protein GCM10018787_27250 [Streptomyces thermodiastaticus]|nr:hypothetical protein GCM10018787_27250 [Streptomyces thermodiastaticus]